VFKENGLGLLNRFFMFNSDIILTFDYQNEHNFEHNIAVMTNFKTPKIYTAKGDLNKRWYVYFSFKNPKTGKFQRMKNIYGIANKFKTKEDRLYVLTTYRRNLIKLLKEGFNPFENNSELIAKKKQENNAVIQTKIEVPVENSSVKRNEEKTEVSMTIKKAIDFALTIKEKTVSERTFKDYSSKSKKFINWLKKEHPKVKTIDQLTKKEVQQYLNYVLSKTTARNRNNYRVEISSLIQVLVDNDIIKSNMVKSIKILKTRPERNKTYSKDKLEEIYSFLENNDPHLLLFIKFISYNLLRPIEVCRVKIKDINLKQKTISFKAKNKVLKTKTIPNILLKELPDLSNCNQDELLFTPHNIGGKWDANENNRRDYFSKRFKKVVKEHFGLDKQYGLYSFRHTFITKLYRELANDYTPFETKSRLMLITGHTTMTALETYLRDIDAVLPEDYSELLKI